MLESIQKVLKQNDGGLLHFPDSQEVLEDLYPVKNRYFFLFKQGIGKTNMGFVELLALLQIHCGLSSASKATAYQVISEVEALEYISENLRLGIDHTPADAERLSSSLKSFFCEKIILNPFYTSASVYIPNGLGLNLERITAESGYVHSCGNLVFSENTQVILPSDAEAALNITVSNLRSDEAFLLVPYCHEHFTSRDRGESEFLKDGLDDVKINISKAYLSETPLHQFILDYVEKNSGSGTSAPTNYKESRARFRSKFGDRKMVTIWLISDSALSSTYDETLGERYLICYRQLYKNDNPYHHYEENKPAWVSHTTLPHSLAGAMINAARPWLTTQNPVLCDPFCGSGTIYLEAQKFPILTCLTSDRSPLAEAILLDNIAFFQLDLKGLEAIIKGLEEAGETERRIRPKSSNKGSSRAFRKDHRCSRLLDAAVRRRLS